MRALGWDVVELENSRGHVVRGFSKKIPLLGKILKVQRYSGEISTEHIGASVVYLEPLDDAPVGFEKAKACFVPSKTIQIDLTKSEETLLKNLKQKTRYNIKIAEKNGVTIKKSQDIDVFLDSWHKEARNRGMWLSQRNEITGLWNAFGKSAQVYFAYKGNELLGGLLIISTPDPSYYMFAASTEYGKKLFAPTFLTWEAIKEAKKNKKKVFDFDGIYDERYKNTENWKGFTRFKEGFGGEVITYPGTFVKYSNPLLKILNF